MTKPAVSLISLCSALPIDAAADGDGVPEWIHLLPAGEIRTADGRGPYTVKSMHAIAAGLKAGDRLPIDECHATDRAAPLGQPAPARGWIVALQAREDGLWGQVEWTGAGKALMADRAYRGVSPVIAHTRKNEVLAVLRASLINTPNLAGLTALHGEDGLSEETGMDWKAKLIELLGLGGDAGDDAIMAALAAKMEDAPVALQAQQIDVFADQRFIALQGELTTATTQLAALRDERSRDAATAFVDGAIAEGRVGVKPLRDDYIAMHMANPDQARKIVGGLPALAGASTAAGVAPAADAGGLTAAQRRTIALMGLDEDEYRKSLTASGRKVEAL